VKEIRNLENCTCPRKLVTSGGRKQTGKVKGEAGKTYQGGKLVRKGTGTERTEGRTRGEGCTGWNKPVNVGSIEISMTKKEEVFRCVIIITDQIREAQN
jgi:hypothetical protein